VSAMGNVTTDAAVKESSAAGGTVSASGNEGKSALGAASKNAQTSLSRSGSNSSVRGGFYQFGIWLSILYAGLMLIAAVIWAVVKSVRGREKAQDGEVVYKNLNVLQIYGRIVKKY